MEYTFREYRDIDFQFVYELKEKCFKWYIEKIYGWDSKIQIELTKKEVNENLFNMNIIQQAGKDIGLLTFYYDDIGDARIGMFAILPKFQGKGIGTQILRNILEDNADIRIYLKTYKENPARHLYRKVGFKKYDETDTHWLMKRQNLIY